MSPEAEERTTERLEETQRRLEATAELQLARAATSELQEALKTRETRAQELMDELVAKDEELRGTVEQAGRRRNWNSTMRPMPPQRGAKRGNST